MKRIGPIPVCSVSFADSTMLLARGPQPGRVAVELSSGELLQPVTWPEISSRSSTTSKQERLTQPRMTRTATNFLHMGAIILTILEFVNCARRLIGRRHGETNG